MKRLLAAAVALSACLAQAATAERPEDRWNLADLYRDAQAWDADLSALEGEIKGFGDCRGKLADSARQLRECLGRRDTIYRRYFRLAVYANELYAEDTGRPASLGLRQRTGVLGARIGEATAFVRPEILAMGKARVDALLAEDPALRIHRHPLEDILRTAPHTLDARGESLVATLSSRIPASTSNGPAGASRWWTSTARGWTSCWCRARSRRRRPRRTERMRLRRDRPAKPQPGYRSKLWT